MPKNNKNSPGPKTQKPMDKSLQLNSWPIILIAL